MSFEVQVGRDFPCLAAEEHNAPIVFNLTNTLSNSSSPASDKPSSHVTGRSLRYCIAATITFGGFILIPAVVYGSVTGDYSMLRSIADGGREVLTLGIKFLKT